MEPIVIKTHLSTIKKALTKPLTVYSLITILFSSYLILRSFGIDLLPPLMEKVGVDTVNNIGVDINGNYIYESFAMDEGHTGYFHGGFFKMEQSVNAYGVTFGLSGFRTWRKYKGQSKEELVYPWSSEWGGIFGGKKIKFTYNILTQDGIKIRGLVEGDIHTDKDGKVEQILCNFNQLPPSPPMYGTMIIKRVNKETVDKSDVYEIVPTHD